MPHQPTTSLVPAAPTTLARPAALDHVNTEVYLAQRIRPYKVTSVPAVGRNRAATVYSFLRGSLSKDSPRAWASVTVRTGQDTFTMAYWPPGGETAQIVEELPHSKIGDAIQDLFDAGFATGGSLSPTPSTPSRPAAPTIAASTPSLTPPKPLSLPV